MRRMFVAAALLTVASCGQPAAPTDVPNVAGTWISQYTLVACSYEGPCSPKTCVDAGTAQLFVRSAVELVVDQNGPHASGTVRLTSRSKLTGDVVSDRIATYSGAVEPSGELSFSARLESQNMSELYIYKWRSRPSHGAISGSFSTRGVSVTEGGSTCRIIHDWRLQPEQ